GQMIERGLRSAVNSPGRVRFNRRVRRDVDDHPGLSQNHRAGDGLDEPEWADGVDLQRPLEILAIRVGNQSQWNWAESTCIVDQDIPGPGQGRRLTNNRINTLLIAYIGDDSESDSAILSDLADSLIKLFLMAGDQRDFRAFGGKAERQSAPQPTTTAGNES